ncbi:MAG TPA: fatty acid desaturase [Acidobacteriaceae bacterium]|nr:fatty acid desaturase [Acidobacteriaceae bacterium]
MLTQIDTNPASTAVAPAPTDTQTIRHTAKTAARPEVLMLGRSAPHSSKRNWVTTIFMWVFHVLSVAALFMFTWKALISFVVLWFFAINMGIGMGYHRLLTHRGYRTPKWMEYFLAICGTLALEGGPAFWVATHRVHHQLTDRPGDPHTPKEGGWWAHAGWIFFGDAMHQEVGLMTRYAPDLAKDPFLRWLSKYHYLPLIVVGLGLLAWGGWPCVMWGVFLRVTLGLHATWLVNSATHMWGSQRFNNRDESRNNWWVALLTGGEGWHNNHHAHPVSARHGLMWYEFDVNYYGIWLLEKIGLASNVNIAKFDKHDPRPAGVA